MLDPRFVEQFQYPLVTPSQRDEPGMWLAWLVRLRWLAVGSQLVVLGFAWSVLTRPAVTLSALGVIIGVLCIENASLARRLEAEDPFEPWEPFAQLAFDVAALVAMLMLTGGATNPFAMLLLIHVALGVIVLRRAAAAALLVSVVAAYAVLQVAYVPLDLTAHHVFEATTLLLAGNVLAFTVTGLTLGGFLRGMVRSMIERHVREVEAAADRAALM